MKCKNTIFLQLLLRQCRVQGETSLSRRYKLPLTCIIWGFGMKSLASRQSVHRTERGGEISISIQTAAVDFGRSQVSVKAC